MKRLAAAICVVALLGACEQEPPPMETRVRYVPVPGAPAPAPIAPTGPSAMEQLQERLEEQRAEREQQEMQDQIDCIAKATDNIEWNDPYFGC